MGYPKAECPLPSVDKAIYSHEQQVLVTVLRRLRRSHGLTQVELAVRLQRPQSFVAKYEAGQRRLDLMELRTIAQALGSTLGDVVAEFEAGL